MSFLQRKRNPKPQTEAALDENALRSVSMASGRLAPIFQRMYLWILSVNLSYRVYQVESGTAVFAGQAIPLRGSYDALLATVLNAILPEYQEELQTILSASSLLDAFQSGKTNVRSVVCFPEGDDDDVRCIELRAECIHDESGRCDAALIYARYLQNEEDLGNIYKRPVPVELTSTGDIDWVAVRTRKMEGADALRYEYEVETDRFHLHAGSGDQARNAVWERFLGSLDSRSDYMIAHNSIKPLSNLIKAGLAGKSGSVEVSFRAGGRKSADFHHYKMTCAPLEDTGTPTWLFGTLTDIEDSYRKQAGLQEITMEISAVIDQIFTSLYVIDTDKDTIRALQKTEGGYRATDRVQKFSDYLLQKKESGTVAPESEENLSKLMQRGFLDRKAAKKPFEMDFRLKLPGSLDFAWYVDTFTPIPGKPHRYMLSRRDITAIYAAKEREYEYGESMRMAEYNQSMLDNIAGLVEFRNVETGAHIYHVRTLSRILMEDLSRRSPHYEMDKRMIDLYCHAAAMHDIGKITTPDAILNKPGKLTPDEYEIMKQHTVEGGKILKRLHLVGQDELKQCCYDVALHHHERWDGKGYPEGLVGDENSIYVQVIGLADVFDALLSERCYKGAYPFDEAMEMICNGHGGVFNPRLMESFMHCQDAMRQVYASTANV